jgi:hypothetical protein
LFGHGSTAKARRERKHPVSRSLLPQLYSRMTKSALPFSLTQSTKPVTATSSRPFLWIPSRVNPVADTAAPGGCRLAGPVEVSDG